MFVISGVFGLGSIRHTSTGGNTIVTVFIISVLGDLDSSVCIGTAPGLAGCIVGRDGEHEAEGVFAIEVEPIEALLANEP